MSRLYPRIRLKVFGTSLPTICRNLTTCRFQWLRILSFVSFECLNEVRPSNLQFQPRVDALHALSLYIVGTRGSCSIQSRTVTFSP